MFQLNEKYGRDQKNLKGDLLRYTPPTITNVNIENCQFFNILRREDAVVSSKNS